MSENARKTAQAAKDFWLSMKSQPRSMKHVHRRPSPQAHGNPADGASDGTGRADPLIALDPASGPSQSIWTVSWGAGGAVKRAGISYPTFDPGQAGPDPSVAVLTLDMFLRAQSLMMQQMLDITHTESPPAPAPIPTLVTTGEIIAWRCWIVDTDGMLRSITRTEVVWDQHKPMVGNVDQQINYTRRGPRYAGVYAFSLKEQAKHLFYNEIMELKFAKLDDVRDYIAGIAYGTVKLWGQVVEHEKGFRAEFARPHEIHGTYYIRKPQFDPWQLYDIPYCGPYTGPVDSKTWTG